MANFVVSICLLLLAFVHTGYTLQCYACDSKAKPECSDPFHREKIPLNQCTAQDPTKDAACIKITTEEARDDYKIKRYCVSYPRGSRPCEFATAQIRTGTLKECKSCTGDGCNPASTISVSSVAILTTCLFSLAHIFRA